MNEILHTPACSRAMKAAEQKSRINLSPRNNCPRCKLNAAAPKLLEACRLTEEAEQYYGPANIKHEMKRKAAICRQAAIAEAEGKEQIMTVGELTEILINLPQDYEIYANTPNGNDDYFIEGVSIGEENQVFLETAQ